MLPIIGFTSWKTFEQYVAGLGDAQFTAKWSRAGRSLDLVVTREETSAGQTFVGFSGRDRWTLSEDGETMKVQGSLSMQGTSDSVNLVFRKKATP